MIRIGTVLIFAVSAGVALGHATPVRPGGEDVTKPPPPVRGLELSAIDQSADDCSDFYQYACGNWMKEIPAPEGQMRGLRSFSFLRERHLYELRQELTTAASNPTSALEKKYGDFYSACMDVEDLKKKGLEPVNPTLERIATLTDRKASPTSWASWRRLENPWGYSR
jgi:putative endopeptidase